ncbi:hypothetical protein [Anaerostipes sp.]|uniref:hypothetical protein n=1 Tax=Anaerostipes sp. TaxID=1872530 RepID=UPI002E7774CC|nr:hypothetical protein [Anaerostipes sp.]MED9814708.1 hypothetical protein [Anaerostipes sp.]
MGKVRQRLGKAYIHTKEESIQSIIIDALVGFGYDVDVEVTDNGTGNEVVSCEIYDVGGAIRNGNSRKGIKNTMRNIINSMLWNLSLFRPKKRLVSSY